MPNLPIKFHQNPLKGLGEVVLTRNVDKQTGGFQYIPKLCLLVVKQADQTIKDVKIFFQICHLAERYKLCDMKSKYSV